VSEERVSTYDESAVTEPLACPACGRDDEVWAYQIAPVVSKVEGLNYHRCVVWAGYTTHLADEQTTARDATGLLQILCRACGHEWSWDDGAGEETVQELQALIVRSTATSAALAARLAALVATPEQDEEDPLVGWFGTAVCPRCHTEFPDGGDGVLTCPQCEHQFDRPPDDPEAR